MRLLGCLALFLVCAVPSVAGAQITLPIYIEDNHASSFYWLAQHLDLEESCTLLHFDAHSDASAIFDSDVMRERVRRVASKEARAGLLDRWRKEGTVQCFNWIEPLMPAPIAQVIWVTPGTVANDERERAQAQAIEQLDGHLGAAPRRSASFANRYRAVSLADLEASPPTGPIVATIDLDSFAGLSPNERAIQFERVWKFVSERPDLRAITIAISRPYLADDAEADALLKLALEGALSLPTARLEFEPFRTVDRDQSLRAREYRAQGLAVPAFDLAKSSPPTRALLLANEARIVVREDNARWQKLLAEWRAAAPSFRLALKDRQPSTDGIWRLSAEAEAELEVLAQPWDVRFDRVQWLVETPAYPRCNLVDEHTLFGRGAPPRPRWREVALSASERRLPLGALAEFFAKENGCGAVRIKARVASNEWMRETPAIEIRRFRGTGFRAALSEQFGLPYLFGSGSLRKGASTGPETGWGADCANYLVYAWRRQGRPIPWSNPRQLRRYLEAAPAEFTAEDVERGVVLHLGSHVAALWEDRPPLGVVNGDDIVAHQLEGAPALLTVDELMHSRNASRYEVLRIPPPESHADFLLGGDVMLGRSVGRQIENGVDPFAGIRSILARAGTKVVNLECVISERGRAVPGKRFHFRAPLPALETLRAAGITGVGLANNHAEDFGAAAMKDARERLSAARVQPIVHGEAAILNDVALLALNDLEPWDRAAVAMEIARVKVKVKKIIAFVHWGEENTSVVTDRQRETARWLIEQGVDFIAGAHAHCLQPTDFYHGRPIVYSLGNLVFDGAPSSAPWSEGQLLELGWNAGSSFPEWRLLPVWLDRIGFPQIEKRESATTAESR